MCDENINAERTLCEALKNSAINSDGGQQESSKDGWRLLKGQTFEQFDFILEAFFFANLC